MDMNPYQSPEGPKQPSLARTGEPSAAVYVLVAFVGIHVLISLALTAINVIGRGGPGIIGGIVSLGFYIAILVGLLKAQEWARISLIWFCYVSLVFYALQLKTAAWLIVPLMGVQLVTLILSHSSPVKNCTKENSVAKTYTYGADEAPPTEDW